MFVKYNLICGKLLVIRKFLNFLNVYFLQYMFFSLQRCATVYHDYTSDFVAWSCSVLSSSNSYAFDRCGEFFSS